MLNLIFSEAAMSNQSRRTFVKSTAAATACAALASLPFAARANPLGLPIGCQTWPVRESIAKDFPGTVKTLAAAGFQSIELCSPIGYADSGFAGLAKYSAAELKKIIADNGVTCVSSHFGIDELRKDQPASIISMHVQRYDLKKNTYAAVGQDSLDWKKIFSAAKTCGIKNYFVEMNLDLMRASVPYLRSLQV